MIIHLKIQNIYSTIVILPCKLPLSKGLELGKKKKDFQILDKEPIWSFETQVDVVFACGVIHNHITRVDPNDLIMGDETCEIESSA